MGRNRTVSCSTERATLWYSPDGEGYRQKAEGKGKGEVKGAAGKGKGGGKGEGQGKGSGREDKEEPDEILSDFDHMLKFNVGGRELANSA